GAIGRLRRLAGSSLSRIARRRADAASRHSESAVRGLDGENGFCRADYLLGWKAYFGMAQTPGVWRRLHAWLRHRLRAIQLRQWGGKHDLPGTQSPRRRANRSEADGGQQPELVAKQ
ncbi:group II intron maturase-specific domain-containing protein, partial [Roseateles sp.]|uniref:group II intron maturase-specific domain-containing protein n=1 Tax=Roseateles sp. TaxID=1971397 RepID=UPI00345D001D